MKAVVIVITVVILLGGAAAAGFYLGLFTPGQKTAKEITTPPPSPSPAKSPTAAATIPVMTPAIPPPTLPSTPIPTATPTVTLPPVTPTTTPPVIPTSTPRPGVNFQISIASVSGTGLSRTVNAQIANEGGTDAHNVWVKAEVFSQQQKIQVSGQDSLRVDVGTIKAGETVIAKADLSFGLLVVLKCNRMAPGLFSP